MPQPDQGEALSDCIFCQIGDKKLAAKTVYEDGAIFAFEDLHPQAPTHVLVCPRKHIESLDEAAAEDGPMLGRLLLVGAQIARERKLTDGFRTVINNGRGAGQSVFHVHLHVLGGRVMRWPPG